MLSPTIKENAVSERDFFPIDFDKKSLTFRPLIFDDTSDIKKIGDIIKKNFKYYVVVGIGGSDLGSRVIANAFKSRSELQVLFIGANTDPVEIEDFFSNINISDCIFNIISKSGETVEIISNFLYIVSKIKKTLGEDKIKEHILVTTSVIDSTLAKFAKTLDLKIIEGKKDVGDRFSVLSVIGLLTADVLGLNIDKILNGAKDMDKMTDSNNPTENISLMFAQLSFLNYIKFGKNISVLMPYSSELYNLGFWFRQLWAESLGKVTKDGKHVGITPVASLGSRDQHSQIQLYNEGPNDKIITFIEVSEFSRFSEIDIDYKDTGYLYKKNFRDIIHIERLSTSLALKENDRSNGTIFIDKISEENIGGLFYFFEMAVSYLGVMLDINTFDQPGVEKGKEYMYALLGKNGFEDLKQKLEKTLNG